jgi:hypothetical protein
MASSYQSRSRSARLDDESRMRGLAFVGTLLVAVTTAGSATAPWPSSSEMPPPGHRAQPRGVSGPTGPDPGTNDDLVLPFCSKVIGSTVDDVAAQLIELLAMLRAL